MCVSFWVLALQGWVTYFSWPDLSKTHWHFGPSLFICNCPSHSNTHTHKETHQYSMCLHLSMGKAKCDIKHTSESKKREMEAFTNSHVEVHLERETRPSDAPVLWCKQWWQKLFFFTLCWFCPCCRMPWINALYSQRTVLPNLKATGREWNTESNEQEDGNWEAFWTNSGIFLS